MDDIACQVSADTSSLAVEAMLLAANILEDMVKLELMASIAPHKAQVLGSDNMMTARLVRSLRGKGGKFTTRQSVVRLGIDYAIGREIGTMSRDKLKSRRSNFKNRMKRFRRLRKVAGKKAMILHCHRIQMVQLY